MSRLLRGLTSNRAETAPDSADARLRGRTYAIPFDVVWTAALEIAGRRRGWALGPHDDIEGVIRAEARTLLRFTHDVEIRVGLDGDGQTRVDLVSQSRVGKADLGKNARRISSFLRLLDRRLAARRRPAADRSGAGVS